jgi:hypothetical protein
MGFFSGGEYIEKTAGGQVWPRNRLQRGAFCLSPSPVPLTLNVTRYLRADCQGKANVG